MANKFCVSITHSKDNTDKATVGFVVANAAVGSGKETLVGLDRTLNRKRAFLD